MGGMTGPQAGFERRVAGRPRGISFAHPGHSRRLRHRPHLAAAAPARPRRPRRRAVHRCRALRHHARALPPGGDLVVAVPLARRGPHAGDRARRVRRAARLLRHAPARPAASRARSCSTKCSSCGRSRASPACATCCAICSRRWRAARNRFVLTHALRGARAPAAARRHLALRGHARAAARRRRRRPTCSRRRSTATSRWRPTTATTSRAPCRR